MAYMSSTPPVVSQGCCYRTRHNRTGSFGMRSVRCSDSPSDLMAVINRAAGGIQGAPAIRIVSLSAQSTALPVWT
jgi:hypothetical protein